MPLGEDDLRRRGLDPASLADEARELIRAAAPISSLPRRVPPKLGRYELSGAIGSGGMAAVYRAKDGRLGREVAVKVLTIPGDEKRRERFLREARAAAGLRHPGLVAVHDVGEDSGILYIVMDLVPGRPADEWASGRSWRDVARMGVRLCRAVAHAHESGVLHRDLKPANVLVTDAGEPVVLDLGLARRSREASDLTEEGEILGTLIFAAPEQLFGDRGAVGEHTDVFGLAGTLARLLTGRAPWEGTDSAFTLLVTAREKEPEVGDLIDPDAPRELARVLRRALARDPEKRTRTVEAFARELEPLLAEKPPPPAGVPRSVIALAVVAAVVVVLVVGFELGRAKATPEPPAVVVVPPAPPPPPKRPSVAERTLAIRDLAASGKLEAALAAADALVADEPRSAAALETRALVHHQSYRIEATRDVARALELDPAAPIALSLRALEKIDDGKVEEGLVLASRALERDPRCATAYYARAYGAYHSGREHTVVLADLDAALREDRRDVFSASLRANILMEDGDVAAAKDWAERALVRDPGMPLALLARARARRAEADTAGAVADLEKALARSPDWTPAHVQLALCHYFGTSGLRDLKKVEDHATRALGADPMAFWLRGLARHDMSRWKEAREDLDVYLAKVPSPQPGAFFARGNALGHLEQWRAAAADFREFIARVKPGSFDAQNLERAKAKLAQCESKLGEPR